MKKKIVIIIIIILVLTLISIFIFDILGFLKNYKKALYRKEKNEYFIKIKVGLITGFGGLGDKAFNDMQYNGLVLAKKLYGIDFEYFAPKNFEDIMKYTQILIDNGSNLIIIGEGFIGQKVLDQFAPKYPQIKFFVLDNLCENLYHNSASVLFKQNEASFLAGVLAAEMTKKDRVGFIGGAPISVIEDFYIGFNQGINYIKSDCKVEKDFISNYVKDFENVWDAPKISYEIAKTMIREKGVDIIFAVASASNIGIFNACKDYSIFSIGVDTDQDYINPGIILTSVLKNLDQAIVFIVDKVIKNNFESKSYYLGLKENGVGLSPMIFTKDIVGDDIIKKINLLQKKIIDGQISVKSVFGK